jgi:acyl carrier protein
MNTLSDMTADNSSENFESIREIISEVTSTDPGEIWPEALLLEDLNIMEDRFILIVRKCEKSFGIKLPLDELRNDYESMTVHQLLNYVEEEIELG